MMAGSPADDLTFEKVDSILDDNGPLLLRVIVIEPMFIAQLVKYGAIPSEESENVRAIEMPSEAKRYLLDIIKGSVESFLAFCIVIHDEMKRDDIVCDEFHLNIDHLKRQKREIEETREKELADVNKR